MDGITQRFNEEAVNDNGDLLKMFWQDTREQKSVNGTYTTSKFEPQYTYKFNIESWKRLKYETIIAKQANREDHTISNPQTFSKQPMKPSDRDKANKNTPERKK